MSPQIILLLFHGFHHVDVVDVGCSLAPADNGLVQHFLVLPAHLAQALVHSFIVVNSGSVVFLDEETGVAVVTRLPLVLEVVHLAQLRPTRVVKVWLAHELLGLDKRDFVQLLGQRSFRRPLRRSLRHPHLVPVFAVHLDAFGDVPLGSVGEERIPVVLSAGQLFALLPEHALAHVVALKNEGIAAFAP